VHLFPERDDRRGRPLLTIALIVSLLVHLAGGGAWGWFGHRLAPAIAKLLPRPSPTPELVALSDAITIEKRSVPREAHRAPAKPRRARPQPRPREVAQLPALRTPPIPTLAPIPTTAPAPQRAYTPAPATIHHPRAAPTPQERPREAPTVTQPSSKNAFSPQQIAALDAQFSRTIAQAQHALTEVPAQRRPPARNPDQQRYDAVMAGTPEQFLSAQGECVSIQSSARGGAVDRYLRCVITYSDGYFEQVSFPWAFRFTRRNDPFQYEDGSYHPFPMQPPPDNFALPHPFALSRAICSFYRSECASVITREKANGNQPATGAP
jgi:hypothetical protein